MVLMKKYSKIKYKYDKKLTISPKHWLKFNKKELKYPQIL